MEQWWQVADRKTPTKSENIQSNSHFFHYIPHTHLTKTRAVPKLKSFAACSKTFTQVKAELQMMDQGLQSSALDSIIVTLNIKYQKY
jgi:hypothetical protein